MKTKLVLLSGFFTIVIVLLISCKKEIKGIEKTKYSVQSNSNSIVSCDLPCLSPDAIGIKHNELLSYIDNNMTPADTSSIENLYSAEISLTKSYFQQNPVCNFISSWVNEAVTKTNDSYIAIKNYNGGTFSRVDAAIALIDSCKDQITRIRNISQTGITGKEDNFIKEILDSIQSIEIDQRCSIYGDFAQNLEQKWKAQNFDTCNKEGYLSRIMIRTMSNSYSFWTNYSYEVSGRNAVAIPFGAALDIIGALTGGLSSIASDILNGNSVNWNNAGVQALLWGAGGSVTGTRWFKRLFKDL